MAEEQETTEPKARRKPKLMPCRACGCEYARERQVQQLQKKLGDQEGLMELCPKCRQKRYAGSLLASRPTVEES